LLVEQCDGKALVEMGAITKISSVFNPSLSRTFLTQREILARRMMEDPSLFRRTDWQKADRGEMRKTTMARYEELSSAWNEADAPTPVMAAVHGTAGVVAWKIVSNGFSVLSSLDAGYYGSGIYFTSSMRYALPYYGTKKQPSVLISLVSPGNPFPVVEKKEEARSFMGQPLRSGYQSHFVLTKKDGAPATEKTQPTDRYDELVIGQESQVMPIFVVEIDQSKLAALLRDFQRTIEVPSGEREGDDEQAAARATKAARDDRKKGERGDVMKEKEKDATTTVVQMEEVVKATEDSSSTSSASSAD